MLKNNQPSKNPQTYRNTSSTNTMSMEEALVALIKRNEELISLNLSKDEFIAITSHQLRTPATAVKQYIALLLQDYAEPLTKNQRVFLEKAYENNERQLRIVDNILRIAQLDLDKISLTLKYTDVSEILREAIACLKGVTKDHHQIVELVAPSAPVLAKIDVEYFRMVCENLLENASNYSPDGKKIIVKLQGSKNGKLRITIKDQGIGIKKSDFPKLYQKFSRLNNPKSKVVSGSGLGLYFCKKIMELHGGDIRLISTVGKGTTFIVIL